ncbi:MAG: molybdopterin molybdotransferase MoeA [Coriobacteriales bacterium]
MRDHSKHIVLTTEEAVRRALEASRALPVAEMVPVEQALGRVLAEDVHSKVTAPSLLSSRMDAVALHWEDVKDGIPSDAGSWERGVQWDFANTGCPLPEGFDTALRIEEVEISFAADGSEQIAFKSAPKEQGEGTSAVGSRLVPGQLLAQKGNVLTPLLLAAVVSGGNTEVPVAVKPKVGFIPTGNELTAPSTEPPLGKTIDTNSTLISSQIREWGGEPVVHEIIPDDYELIKRTILEMCAVCDIVVINAGSSKGSDDWTMEILDEIGQVINHETNHAPSKHSAYAVVADTVVVGISGPAGGAAFTSEFYLKPLICRALGLEPYPPAVPARLAAPFPAGRKPGMGPKSGSKKAVPEKFYFIRHMATRIAEDGVLEVEPVEMGCPLEQNRAGAYYSLDRDAQEAPAVGSMIQVHLRWPYKLS